MTRDIVETINTVIKHIPDDFEHKETVRVQLEGVKRDAGYMAPEMAGESWVRASFILEHYIRPQSDLQIEWAEKIRKFWVEGFTGDELWEIEMKRK